MDFGALLAKYSMGDFPAALTGCRNAGYSHECCEYDLAVFDERREPETVIKYGGHDVCISHCSLAAPRSEHMVRYDGMKIILDESWDLHMMLSRIGEKREELYRDCMRNSLIDSMFCITKFRAGAKNSDPIAPCWLKCSAIYMADAILFSNLEKPSPTHALQKLRRIQKKNPTETLSLVHECMGTERATSLLLDRMAKSTAGFSDAVDGNDRSQIFPKKTEYLESESLLTDCYFYLQYSNRDLLVKIKDDIAKRRELFYILKVAMDLEGGITPLATQADRLYDEANRMLSYGA